jgi:tryptophan 7-halogenase
MPIPDSLAAKIELFRAKGRVFREGMELFGTTSWVAVFLGQNIVPEDYEPAIDALDVEKVAAAMEDMHRSYAETAQRLPTHAEFIASCCSAVPEDHLPSLEELIR